MRRPKSILITGAARGLGAALAMAYARPGVHLFLNDVRAEKLQQTAEACGQAGAQVRAEALDITDRPAMQEWVRQADAAAPLDLVIANAAISHGKPNNLETAEQIYQVFEANLMGGLNTILPALELFRARGSGHIALLSSLAEVRGLPVAPSYCASKAALRVFGEGLAAMLRREGVLVTTIIPGFMKTPMSGGNQYNMPFVMELDRAVAKIQRGLAKGRTRICFPWPLALGAWLLKLAPQRLVDRIVAKKK